ncbi:hypothetical protein [Bacillus piscicola]|uniref:SLAC1 family transporter n=1 Tax=Bacillus piscicola TaxID=1632684 RepID=UPI001F096006|nr:hypothetical protein [Bacillus piscicola]
MEFIVGFIIILSVLLVVKACMFKSGSPNPANGAIVMASGIFLLGAAHRFPMFSGWLGDFLAMALLAVAVMIAATFVKTARQGEFRRQFTEPKIKSFAIGTWVAGTSVLGNVLLQQFPEVRSVVLVLAIWNGALWLFYLTIVIKRFKELYTSDLYKQAHGILLLSTVSTQSIAILYFNVFGGQLPGLFFKLIIYAGVLFYALGFYLIMKRYRVFSEWSVADDWQNTNCILHGAMSITGLAAATTGAVSDSFTMAVWLWVLTWFVIVESVEIWRAKVRVNQYGTERALGQYNATQWSRNFTFGMLYAFTMQFDLAATTFAEVGFLVTLREIILTVGAWIVLLFLLNEVLLWIKARYEWKPAALFKKKAIPTANPIHESNRD